MLDSLAGLGPMDVFAVLGLVAVFLLVTMLKIAAALALLILPFFPMALWLQKALRPSKVVHRPGD